MTAEQPRDSNANCPCRSTYHDEGNLSLPESLEDGTPSAHNPIGLPVLQACVPCHSSRRAALKSNPVSKHCVANTTHRTVHGLTMWSCEKELQASRHECAQAPPKDDCHIAAWARIIARGMHDRGFAGQQHPDSVDWRAWRPILHKHTCKRM